MQKWLVSITGCIAASIFIGCSGVNSPVPSSQAATPPAATTNTASTPTSWRFIGLNALKSKTNLVAFNAVSSVPEFDGLRTGLAERLALHFAQAATGSTNNDLPKLLRPITEDILAYQSIFDQQGTGTNSVCTLAVELPADRHELWKSNWDPILKLVKVPNAKLTREGKWSLVSNGPTKTVLDRAARPSADVLEFTGDGALLKKIFPKQTPHKFSLRVLPQGSALRTEGKFTFANNLNLNLKPFDVPTNTIREPLNGFTAIQGFAKDHLTGWGPFKNAPAPDQVFIWNDARTPFTIFAAAKVGDPAALVRNFATGLNLADLGKKLYGNLQFNTNTSTLQLRDVPIAVPFLSPAHEADKGFLFAGLMPLTFSGKPIPQELVKEFTSRPNLLFYDWEFTYARLDQFQPMSQIPYMVTGRDMPTFSHPAQQWMKAAKALGNAVTEIIQSGPRELTLTRGSDVGLSAAEIYLLTAWIAGPEPKRGKGGPMQVPAPGKAPL